MKASLPEEPTRNPVRSNPCVHFFKALGYALRGIRVASAAQRNTPIFIIVMVVVISSGIYLGLSTHDWAIISLAAGLLWMAEAFNTAIEILANRVTREWDPQIRDVKDVAAGAVLFFALGGVAMLIFVFWPHVMAWLKHH